MIVTYHELESIAQMVKNLPAMQDNRFNPWMGKIHYKGNGNPLQYSCLGNPMDGGAWWATGHGVAKRPSGVASDFVTKQQAS